MREVKVGEVFFSGGQWLKAKLSVPSCYGCYFNILSTVSCFKLKEEGLLPKCKITGESDNGERFERDIIFVRTK